MANVSKIIKMNDDGVSAISKAKGNNDIGILRHRSTQRERAALNGTLIPRRISGFDSANKNQSNSLEDLKSHISKGSFVKDLYQKNISSLTPARNGPLISSNPIGLSAEKQSGRNKAIREI